MTHFFVFRFQTFYHVVSTEARRQSQKEYLNFYEKNTRTANLLRKVLRDLVTFKVKGTHVWRNL